MSIRFLLTFSGILSTKAFAFSSIGQRGVQRTVVRMSSSSSLKNVLVPVANGSEEIESVSIIDTLVRGGAKVTVASVESTLMVRCSRGVKLEADVFISSCVDQKWDLIALPGGMPGAERLRDSTDLDKLLRRQNADKNYIAAMCASPAVVLASKGLLAGMRATCYPYALLSFARFKVYFYVTILLCAFYRAEKFRKVLEKASDETVSTTNVLNIFL